MLHEQDLKVKCRARETAFTVIIEKAELKGKIEVLRGEKKRETLRKRLHKSMALERKGAREH